MPAPGHKSIRVLVDGVVYGFQKYGGINTYFDQILRRLARRPDMFVDLLVPAAVVGKLPAGRIGRLRRHLLPLPATDFARYWPEPFTYDIIHEIFPQSRDSRTGRRWARLLAGLSHRLDDLVLAARVRGRPPTVFHSTYFTLPACPLPQVAMAHDLNHELLPAYYDHPYGEWLRRVIKASIRQATRVIAVSAATKRDVCRLYAVPEEKVDVVHHGINPQEFYPEYDPERLRAWRGRLGLARPFLLFVGTREGFKNFACLWSTFQQRGLRRDYDLVAAGAPWSREELAQFAGIAEDPAVKNVVWPATPDLRALYSLASVFVYPSLGEGFGLPLLEAMACGTPVAASDIDVFHEVAGDAAVYFDPQTPDDLGRRLDQVLGRGGTDELVARGRERVQFFSWDRAAAKTRAVYAKAMAAV